MEEEDLAVQLRQQLEQAAGDKEQVKLELEGLKRLADGHLMRLQAVLGTEDISRERLAAAVQAFDTDLKSRVSSDLLAVDDSREGAYDVLRNCLSDAQKRCQELNADMLRVADANEELHSTLRTLKGTNRRLVEEVQRQTEELSHLTTQRLKDIESLKYLEDTFSQERTQWALEAQKSLEEEQHRCDDEFGRTAQQLADRLRDSFIRAEDLSSKSCGIKAMHGELKAEVQGFSQSLGADLKRVERTIVEKISATTKQLQDERTRLKDRELTLQVKLTAEREVREGEMEAFKRRHSELSDELDGLTAKKDREVSDLQARIAAVEAVREKEASVTAAQRVELHNRLENMARDVAFVEANMQTARRKALQLEGHVGQCLGERERLQSMAEDLQQQVRDSDEALTDALRGNEALREQMELQRLDAQNACERDMKLCREMFDRRAEAQAQSNMQTQADIAARLQALEEGLGQKAGEIQAAKEALAQRTRMRDSLQRDAAMWKAQHELAAKMRNDVERDLVQFRQDCLQGELTRRHEQKDELAAKVSALEARRSSLLDEAKEQERISKAQESADEEQVRALAEQKREAAAELQRTKAGLAEAETGLAAARAEAASLTQQMSERRDVLQQELARLTAEAEAERQELEQRVQSERLSRENLLETVDRLRDEHRTSYRAALEGPEQQISALEGSICEIQRNAGTELSGLRQRSEKLRARVEELEGDVSRAQAALAQTEHELQDSTAYVKLAKSNHRSAKEALDRELNAKTAELQQVQRSIQQKSDQLRSIEKVGEDSRRRMLRDVESARASKAKQLSETDFAAQVLRAERSTSLEDADRTRATATSPTTPGVGSQYYSDQMRSYGEPCTTTSPLKEVGEQMQRALANMEGRAAELRRAFQH